MAYFLLEASACIRRGPPALNPAHSFSLQNSNFKSSLFKMTNSPVRIGINGFGRIGRLVCRSACKNPLTVVAAINDPFMDLDYMVYLFQHDSVHGKYDGIVSRQGDALVIDGISIQVSAEKNPNDIPWGKASAD